MQVVSSFEKSNNKNVFKLVESQDKTVYFTLPQQVFMNCPSFRLHPDEFTNTVLDLSVGGGYIQLEMDGYEAEWKTFFETGTISIKAINHPQRSEYNVIQPAVEKVSNSYLTKFFKQACNIAPMCLNLVVYIRIEGPILLQFEMENESSELVISIVPVIR